MQELGHVSESYRLVRGLFLEARCGDHEIGAWAMPVRTIWTGHEWVQRRMALNAKSDLDVEIDDRSREPTAKELAQLEADQVEFRIWNDEAKAALAIQHAAELDARRKKFHEARKERWRLVDEQQAEKGEEFLQVQRRRSEQDAAVTFIHPPPEPPILPTGMCGCGSLLAEGLSVCRDCDPETFGVELRDLLKASKP